MVIRAPRLRSAVLGALFLAPLAPHAARPDEPLADVAPAPREVTGAHDVGRLDGDVRIARAILVLPSRDPAGRRPLPRGAAGSGLARFPAMADAGGVRGPVRRPGGRRRGPPRPPRGARPRGRGRPRGRSALLFSGRAADVERAFDTELREVFVNGGVHVANVRPARLPATLAARTAGLLSLNNFARRRALAHRAPSYTDFSGGHSLAPADFSTIYGVDALAAADQRRGTEGRGRRTDERQHQ